jgi:hypothetical protein
VIPERPGKRRHGELLWWLQHLLRRVCRLGYHYPHHLTGRLVRHHRGWALLGDRNFSRLLSTYSRPEPASKISSIRRGNHSSRPDVHFISRNIAFGVDSSNAALLLLRARSLRHCICILVQARRLLPPRERRSHWGRWCLLPTLRFLESRILGLWIGIEHPWLHVLWRSFCLLRPKWRLVLLHPLMHILQRNSELLLLPKWHLLLLLPKWRLLSWKEWLLTDNPLRLHGLSRI